MLASLAVILLLLGVGSVAASHANQGFETGTFSGWTRAGTPKTMGSDSGSGAGVSWVREVGPAYAAVGSFGARLRCEEAGASSPDWWCTAGESTTFTTATGIGIWYKLVEATGYYWSSDLTVTVGDGTGSVSFVRGELPNWRCDQPGPAADCANPGPGKWVWECLDAPGFFQSVHGRPISTPFTVNVHTYADETVSEVWVDEITHEQCGDEPDPPQPPCLLTGEAYMVNTTAYPPPAGVTTVWSERTGPVATTSSQHYGPTATAHVAGPIVNGYAWGSEIETFADPECRSESRASVAHLDGGPGLPPSLLPLEARGVEAWSTSNCNGFDGGVTIGYLRIGSLVVDVSNTPPPNTVVVSGPVTVILNEQRFTPLPWGGVFEVNAIRVIVSGVLDAKIVGAISDIHECLNHPPPPPPPPRCIGVGPLCVVPPPPPPPPPTCPPGTVGVYPVCVPPTPCPPPSVGVHPACFVVTCPPPTWGIFPDCRVDPIELCEPPTIGVYPNCHEVRCPPGTSGTFPNCRIDPVEECPPGSFGVPPLCAEIWFVCPPGTSGEFPDCRVEPIGECPIDFVEFCLGTADAETLPEAASFPLSSWGGRGERAIEGGKRPMKR